jgi:hypothetical protein
MQRNSLATLELSGTSKTEQVFQVIGAIRAEFTRLRHLEKDYETLREEHMSLLSKLEKEKARTATWTVPTFQFNLDAEHGTGHSASSLQEFYNNLGAVPAKSLEFHLNRQDFEAWLASIGQEELAQAFIKARGENLSDGALRSRLREEYAPARGPHRT